MLQKLLKISSKPLNLPQKYQIFDYSELIVKVYNLQNNFKIDEYQCQYIASSFNVINDLLFIFCGFCSKSNIL